MQFRIFLSSVQSEFADERARLRAYIEKSPLLRRFFSVFVFESDVPPQDRRTDEVYADRLEIYNPGSINPALTPEKLMERHGSFPNNPLMAEPLYLTRYIERLGTGLTDLDDLYGRKVTEKVTGRSLALGDRILAAIAEAPNISQRELAERLGVNRAYLARVMSAMQRNGLIRRIGPDKGGHWEVVFTAISFPTASKRR